MNYPASHVLDNPVLNALTKKQAHLSQGREDVFRYSPDVAPFGAVVRLMPETLRELAFLGSPESPVLLQSLVPLPVMENVVTEELGIILQMVDLSQPQPVVDKDIVRLNDGDIDDMLALTRRTKPGPFGKRTCEMGQYIGVRDEGRLVAMAGERMQVDGYTEISAVCVDDGYRGKGLGGRLIDILRLQILEGGNVPFLHVFEHNQAAVSLYKRIGFETRKKFVLYRIAPAREALRRDTKTDVQTYR